MEAAPIPPEFDCDWLKHPSGHLWSDLGDPDGWKGVNGHWGITAGIITGLEPENFVQLCEPDQDMQRANALFWHVRACLLERAFSGVL